MDHLLNRVSRRRRPGQGGFTLIELLVVIAVLAILATIVIFNVVGVANRGQSSACATDLKSLQTASDAYYNDNTKYSTADGTTATAFSVTAPGKNGVIAGGYLHVTATQAVANTGAITMDPNGTLTAASCPAS
jgi:prepilin-type N-terminal cleavage/methylation domain-containing protein